MPSVLRLLSRVWVSGFFFAMRKNVWSWICFFFHVWLNENIFVHEQQNGLFTKQTNTFFLHEWVTVWNVFLGSNFFSPHVPNFFGVKTSFPLMTKTVLFAGDSFKCIFFFIPWAKPLGHEQKIWFHTQKIVSRVTIDKNFFNVQIFFYIFLYEQNVLAMSEKCVLKIEKCFHCQLFFFKQDILSKKIYEQNFVTWSSTQNVFTSEKFVFTSKHFFHRIFFFY